MYFAKKRVRNSGILVALVLILSACETTKKVADSEVPKVNPDQNTSQKQLAYAETAVNEMPSVQNPVTVNKKVPYLSMNQDGMTFNVAAVNTPAKEFFMSLVRGQNKNIVVHPDVGGSISINLQNVTLEQALTAVCDVYDYDFIHSSYGYKVIPKKLQSRIFKVSYLNVNREGKSVTRVNSGQVEESASGATGAQSDTGTTANSNSNTESTAISNSEVQTTSHADFWKNIEASISAILGNAEGTRVVVSPQAGLVLVEGYSSQLDLVEHYLKSAEHALLKQVIIEAKILEVELNDKFNAGVQWDTFEQGFGGKLELNDSRVGAGLASGDIRKAADMTLGGVFSVGLNFTDFTSIIEVLKTQGDVQVLSSPRISTVNNQKAIIKVGNEEYFVTNITTQATQSVSGPSNSTNVVINPFFSGIALDVTPQISDDDIITLHIHPTVTTVTDKIKEVGLSDKPLILPLAYTTVRESDSIVKARSGQVIVLGGLIQNKVSNNRADVPWLYKIPLIGLLFTQRQDAMVKSEMVILLRPKVVDLDAGDIAQEQSLIQERFPSHIPSDARH